MPTTAARTRPVARATGLGILAAAVPCLAVYLSGAVPTAQSNYVLVGFGAAVVAALLVALTQRGVVLSDAGGDPRFAAARLQSWLGMAFGAKLLVLAVGVGTLSLAGLKFEALATFALTFVGAALVSQLAAAGYLVRVLGRTPRQTKNQP